MKAIVLAAGQGTRLAPYTNDRPKCMVEIGAKPMISYVIDNMKAVGIEDINIVTGYKRELIDFSDVNYYFNPEFATTNMVESLFYAEEVMDDEIVISYGDIVYEKSVLDKLVKDKSDVSVIIDDSWEKLWRLRNDNPLADAETLKLDKNNKILEIGAKPGSYDEIESQYIGLMKFSLKGIKALKEMFHLICQESSEKEIIRGRTNKKIYMTDMLQLLIDQGCEVKGVRINSGWFEIDTKEDYEMICQMHKNNKLKEFCDMTNMGGCVYEEK